MVGVTPAAAGFSPEQLVAVGCAGAGVHPLDRQPEKMRNLVNFRAVAGSMFWFTVAREAQAS
jgi:hypothetical protein